MGLHDYFTQNFKFREELRTTFAETRSDTGDSLKI